MTSNKRKKQKEFINRESIVDSCEKIFFEKGFLATSIDDICQASQYSRRTVYKYFESKEDIYDAIILRAYFKLYEEIRSFKGETPVEKIKDMLYKAYKFAENNSGYMKVITQFQLRKDDFDPYKNPVHKNIYTLDTNIFNLLCLIISEGVGCGVFRKGIKPELASLVVNTIFIGFIDMYFSKSHYSHDKIRKTGGNFMDEIYIAINNYLIA